MANLPSDLFNEIDKARVGGGGNYINHGTYVMMVDKWFFQKIQDRCIILEMIVAEARPNIVYEGDKKVEQEPNVVGSSASDTANFDGDGKLSAAGNSRAPVLGLFDLKENDASLAAQVGQTLDQCIGPAQPARGMLVCLTTFPKKIRSPKPGGPTHITGRTYSCFDKPGVGANAPDKVKARLDALARGQDEFLRVVAQHIAESRAEKAGGTSASNLAPPPAVAALANNFAPPPAAAALASNLAPPPAAAAPAIPPLPAPPAVPAPPAASAVPWYVAEGWQSHPQNPDYYFRGNEVRSKSDLIASRP
jgi:hypothetical protein